MSFSSNADEMLAALRVTPGWSEMQVAIDDEDIAAILSEAAKVAKDVIAPLNTLGDRVGAQFTDGTVKVPVEYRKAYQALAEGGWIGIEHQPDLGGQGLPLTLFVAVNQLFERACPAFMMALGGTCAAARLLTEWADDQTRSDWVPALLSGEATATICISEPEAGSDVGRIRTNAVHTEDGWYLSGQKIWISFGDHDILSRVGHCVLARTSDTPGTRGLSLFLVPRTERVKTLRIEEKLGLHGSPTCALSFENAHGILLGEEGRGLAQLFTMIRHMRLMVACQGLGTAQSCFDAAREYAHERRQGGNPAEPAVPIIQHADVQLQLADMMTAIDLFRLALVETVVASDLAQTDPVMARRSALFLPLVKNFGAELGFNIAGRAIMVFGGSGFTKCPGMIIQLSTDGRSGAGKTSGGMLPLSPYMASLSVGSNNFPTRVYENPPDLVDGLASEMRTYRIKPEVEAFDLSHIHKAAMMHAEGQIIDTPYVQFVMGVKNAMPVDRDVFDYYVKTVKRLFGDDAPWCAAGIGAHQLTLNEWAVLSGGHARTGLEDNVRLDREKLAPSNAALVKRVVDLCQTYERPVATWQQARAILGLKKEVAQANG